MSEFIHHQKKQWNKLGWKYVVTWLILPFGMLFYGVRRGYKFFHLKISNRINNKLKRLDKKLYNWFNKFTNQND